MCRQSRAGFCSLWLTAGSGHGVPLRGLPTCASGRRWSGERSLKRSLLLPSRSHDEYHEQSWLFELNERKWQLLHH